MKTSAKNNKVFQFGVRKIKVFKNLKVNQHLSVACGLVTWAKNESARFIGVAIRGQTTSPSHLSLLFQIESSTSHSILWRRIQEPAHVGRSFPCASSSSWILRIQMVHLNQILNSPVDLSPSTSSKIICNSGLSSDLRPWMMWISGF